MMRFIEMKNSGGPEVLKISERAAPIAGPGEVLIEVHAAGINRPDVAQRQGSYPPPLGASDILGLEVAGVIAACGQDVTRWKVGDQVCALVSGGGYAEYVNAPEGQCLPMPSHFSMIEAAAVPETFFTVWTNLYDGGDLKEGETVLIHGGAGGIGTTAIQLAHALGSKVFTTVGKKESVQICKDLGADRVIQYKEEDFVEVIKKESMAGGADVILDMIAGDYFNRNLEALLPKGRLVQIATLQGAKVELDLRKVMAKRLVLTGSTLRPRSVVEKTKIAQELEKTVWPLLDKGKLKPIIYKTFPLAEAEKAHALMESSAHTGKIVLTIK